MSDALQKVRVGIAGFDHFYAGLDVLEALKKNPDAELVVAAHHDLDHLKSATEGMDVKLTTNYREIVDANIDLLVTACPTSQNAHLVIAAAQQGKHIISVKPFAMTLEDADQIVAAVKLAGVHFMSFDGLYRLRPQFQQYKTWLKGEELGRPISTFCMMRSVLPEWLWFGDPYVMGRSWWLDPTQSPGGGWLDHAIYYIDMLRWLFDSEVVRVSGEISNLKHPDEALEDFGVANLVFDNGAVATVEVTWSVERGGFATAFHLVGTNGHLLSDSAGGTSTVRRINFRNAEQGWQDVEPIPDRGDMTAHMIEVIRGEASPVCTVDDSYSTLAACLAFYEAAKEMKVVTL